MAVPTSEPASPATAAPSVPPRGTAATAEHGTTRRNNLALVLTHLRTAGPRSRARLADETGLNKATVSSLVGDLIERGLLAEGEPLRGAVGRPGQNLELDGRLVWGIGAEIDVGSVAVLATDLRGTVVAEERRQLDTTAAGSTAVLEAVAELLRRTLGEAAASGAVPMGVCVAGPGLVERSSGTVSLAANLGWQAVPVVADLRSRLGRPGLPVLLENAANLAAVAEVDAVASVAPRPVDLVLVTGGAGGVGGGLVSGGRLLRGGRGLAGEVGHMCVDPHGRECSCGRRGCWETVVGLGALLATATDRDDPVRDPGRPLEQRLAELARRAAAADDRTLHALGQVACWLGVGGGILVNVLDPDVLVFGGWFGVLSRWLAEPARAELHGQVLVGGPAGGRVEFSSLGPSAALRGAARTVLDEVFRDPTRAPAGSRSGSPVG